jgi:protein transport protein SEC13
MLATASSDTTISVLRTNGTLFSLKLSDGLHWQVSKPQEPGAEPGVCHQIGVNAISWAPVIEPFSLVAPVSSTATKRFVSGGCDNKIKIWKETDG